MNKRKSGNISRKKNGYIHILSHPIFHIFLLLAGCLVIVAPFLEQGFFPTHDGEWTVVRLAEMFREVRDGQIPARYSTYLNFGYGYPLFNFAYPFPYYFGLPLVLAGIGYVTTIKLIFVATVPLSAVGMYLIAKKTWENNWAAFTSAMLYIFLPYRILDLYVRGSIGESVAFAIVPWLLYAGLGLKEKNKMLYIGLFGLLVGALLTSHNIMGLYFMPLVLFLLITKNIPEKKANWKALFIATTLGVGACLFFILPALIEKSLIYLANIPIADRNLYWVTSMQLIVPSWGYGTPTDSNSFTYQLGIAQVIAFILFVIFLLSKFTSEYLKWKKYLFPLSLLVVSLTMITLMFEPTKVIWEGLPLLREINYPWTLLGPLGFTVSLSAGYTVTKIKYPMVLALILICVAFITTYSYAQPKERVDRGEGFYTTNNATTTSSREYTPLWAKSLSHQMPDKRIEIIEGKATIEEIKYQSNEISFSYSDAQNARMRINTIYYPGWRVYVNNVEKIPDYSNDKGVMEIVVNGSGNIVAKFSETPLRSASNFISLSSIVILVLLSGIGLYRLKK